MSGTNRPGTVNPEIERGTVSQKMQDSEGDEFAELIANAGLDSSDIEGFSSEIDSDLKAWKRISTNQASAGEVALVVTNILQGTLLLGLLLTRGIDAKVVETESGCVVWKELSPNQANEMDALLGEERPLPKEAEILAEEVSKISPYGAVLLVSTIKDQAEEDPGVHGQIVGRVYYDGKFDRIIPAGPMVSCCDEKIEDLLLGRTTPADYPPVKRPRLRDIVKWYRDNRGNQ